MTRDEGLAEIGTPTCTDMQKQEEIEYIIKKLDISQEEWDKIMSAPAKSLSDYRNENQAKQILVKCKNCIVRTNRK